MEATSSDHGKNMCHNIFLPNTLASLRNTRRMNTSVIIKRCSVCQRILPLEEFHRRRHRARAGVRSTCKGCTAAATRAARPIQVDRNKHRVRARTRQAIKQGLLVPLRCQWPIAAGLVCGAQNVDGHHPSYEGPDAHLQVVWLCKEHHALLHGKHDWTKQLELF